MRGPVVVYGRRLAVLMVAFALSVVAAPAELIGPEPAAASDGGSSEPQIVYSEAAPLGNRARYLVPALTDAEVECGIAAFGWWYQGRPSDRHKTRGGRATAPPLVASDPTRPCPDGPPEHLEIEIPLDGDVDLRALNDVELRALKRRLVSAVASNGG